LVALPAVGIVGVSLAQLAQQTVIIAVGWAYLRRNIDGLGWFPFKWRFAVFKATSGYAIKLNSIGIFLLFFDPLVKFCLNRAAGTEAVGYYELAARLIVQMRGLVVSAAMPLIPALAEVKTGRDAQFGKMLRNAQKFVSWAAIGVAIASLAAAPLISMALLDEWNTPMLSLNAILTLGWAINLLSLPLYIAAQAHGQLRWNIASHIVLASSVLVSALIPVTAFSQYIVAFGVAIGLALGSAVAIGGNARLLSVSWEHAGIFRAFLLPCTLIGLMCIAVLFLHGLP
jgi:O-antigen/teichoic acid export membrane protein